MINSKFIIWNICVVLVLLVLVELVAFMALRVYGTQKPFFLNLTSFALDEKRDKTRIIDPLLGWSKSPDQLMNTDKLLLKNNLVYFNLPKVQCDSIIKLLITGGSTSDVTFDQKNWPYYFNKKLQEHYPCIELAIGAENGYNSGQELLKLLRDGLPIQPDIHLSFSGPNDSDPSYTSLYEDKFFKSKLQDKLILPNFQFWIASFKKQQTPYYENKIGHLLLPNDFWITNMQAMHGIADQKGYQFIGILSPVVGIGNNWLPENEMEKYTEIIERYQRFYPPIIETINHTPYLTSFTGIFDTIDQFVFVDDCHIEDTTYQKMISDAIYHLLFDK